MVLQGLVAVGGVVEGGEGEGKAGVCEGWTAGAGSGSEPGDLGSDSDSDDEVESGGEEKGRHNLCAGLFKGCVTKKMVTPYAYLREIRVQNNGGGMDKVECSSEETLTSRAWLAARIGVAEIARDHKGVLLDWKSELKIRRDKYQLVLESCQMAQMAQSEMVAGGDSAVDLDVTEDMVHTEETHRIENTMTMYMDVYEMLCECAYMYRLIRSQIQGI